MLGWGNPLPFQLGGGLTYPERTYQALRSAMGGAAGPVGSVEDEWRKAKAMILCRGRALIDCAFFQAFPGMATEQIAIWEGLLGLAPARTLAERQVAAENAFTRALDFSIPGMRADLKAIDPTLDVVTVDHNLAITTRLGKPFEIVTGQTPAYYNTASEFLCTIIWSDLPSGIPDPAKLAAVKAYLAELPAWIDWNVINGVGFYLDGYNNSRLDLTAFA